MKLYLIGFMGVGKTRVGRSLARRLGLAFQDLDNSIERQAGTTIREIFARDGEERFRDLEHAALRATADSKPAVIATGGGAFIFERNRRLIDRLGESVWIDVDFDTIVGRLGVGGRARRPLFQDLESARQLFEARRAAYALADRHFPIPANTSSEVVADTIARSIREEPCAIS